MGRYPFLTLLSAFLEDVRPYYAEVSHGNMSRKLRQIHGILQELKTNDPYLSTNPLFIGERELGALLDYMNARTGHFSKPMKPGTQVCLLGHLSVFLEYNGNAIVSKMRKKKLIRVRCGSRGPLPCPSEDTIEDTVAALEEAVTRGDLKAFGVLGLLLLGAYAGMRPREARLATIGDLDTRDWTLVVMHPKGERTWGRTRRTKVVNGGRSALESFLRLRAEELQKRGIPDSPMVPLVPCFRSNGSVAHWSGTYALQVKKKLEKSLGLAFDFQMHRRAFGMNALDRNVRLDSISVVMGHSSTKTTELYYARRKEQHALNDLEDAWSAS